MKAHVTYIIEIDYEVKDYESREEAINLLRARANEDFARVNTRCDNVLPPYSASLNIHTYEEETK